MSPPIQRRLVSVAADLFEEDVDPPGGTEDAAAFVYRVGVLPMECHVRAGTLQEVQCSPGIGQDGEIAVAVAQDWVQVSGWPTDSSQFPGADAAARTGIIT